MRVGKGYHVLTLGQPAIVTYKAPPVPEMPWDRTIRELQEENTRLLQMLRLGDAPASDPSPSNPATPNPVRERIDGVIKDLADRQPLAPDRKRLRDALDKADAPQTGRAGADEALGRAIRWSER